MLPINFHKTFVPERRLIGALLHYAALGKQGTYQEIGDETGIPMGESTGKVPAVLDYARGMGLVELADEKGAVKRPLLTPLGRVVYSEDRYLGEKVTQWIAHMNLCRGDIGAHAWWSAFAEGRRVLGSSFTRAQLENHLIDTFGSGIDRTGPLIRTYTDDAALGRAGVLACSGDLVERRRAPVLDSSATAYSAMVLTFMEVHFPTQVQVTIEDLADKTLWFDTCLWEQDDVEQVCLLLQNKGFVAVDRQMRPWILEKRATAEAVWPRIFDDMAYHGGRP